MNCPYDITQRQTLVTPVRAFEPSKSFGSTLLLFDDAHPEECQNFSLAYLKLTKLIFTKIRSNCKQPQRWKRGGERKVGRTRRSRREILEERPLPWYKILIAALWLPFVVWNICGEAGCIQGAMVWDSLSNDCRTAHTFRRLKWSKSKPCLHARFFIRKKFKKIRLKWLQS